MPLVPRTVLCAKPSGSSKKYVLPSGKENERPSTSTTADNRKGIVPRRRSSLCSNDDRRKELRGTLAIGDCFALKKTQFRVHCDEKPGSTAESIAESIARSNGLVSLPGDRTKCDSSSLAERVRGSWRKRSTNIESRKEAKLLPSKIPRRVSGSSRSISVVASSGSGALDGGQTTRNRTIALERTGSQIVRDKKPSCVDSIATTRPRSTSTPKDALSELSPILATVRFSEIRFEAASRRTKSTSEARFSGNLLCNADYHADLPIVEREREDRAPRLSASFLGKHVNAEQRALVVAFVLHLGTHCRYPSHIVYQAVKLFDATVDKIPVNARFVQLSALCSLWIMLKTLQNFHKIPTASTVISLAKDLYAGREDLLISFERKILQALNFNVFFVDAYSLLAYHLINYRRCTDPSQETFEFLYHAGGYAIDLTLLDERFCRTSVRLIALTAAELVLGIVLDTVNGIDELPKRPRWLFWRGLLYAAGPRSSDRFQDQEIDQCRVAMLRCLLMSGRKNSRFEVVFKKYSRSRYGRIAASFIERVSALPVLETFDP